VIKWDKVMFGGTNVEKTKWEETLFGAKDVEKLRAKRMANTNFPDDLEI
jgi:hypothetical protein